MRDARVEVKLRPARLDEFESVLKFAATAFGKDDPRWFAKNRPTIFQRTPESVGCHRIATDSKGIAGLIGIYPLRMKVGTATLRVGGIGTVSVRSDARGSGLMSGMLNDTIQALEDGGYDLSWLGGNRFRYGNYGWDHGGRRIEYTVRPGDIARWLPGTRPARIRACRAADIATLSKAYATLGGGIERSPADWRILLRHAEVDWFVGTAQGATAYLACWNRDHSVVIELAGDPSAAAALLLAHGTRADKQWLQVHSPQWDTKLCALLYGMSETFCVRHMDQIRLVNVESTWRKLVGAIARTARESGVVDASARLTKVKSAGDRSVILKRALGFFDAQPAMPARLRSYEWVRPIRWWFSLADEV